MHEDFWSYFDSEMNAFANNLVSSKNAAATGFVNRLIELQRVLSVPKKTRGNGLSAFRNAINYQHQYGTWYPFSRSKMVDSSQKKGKPAGPQSQILKQNNSSISLSYDPERAPLAAFGAAICFIAMVNVDLVKQFKARNRDDHQFFKNWDKLVAAMGNDGK